MRTARRTTRTIDPFVSLEISVTLDNSVRLDFTVRTSRMTVPNMIEKKKERFSFQLPRYRTTEIYTTQRAEKRIIAVECLIGSRYVIAKEMYVSFVRLDSIKLLQSLLHGRYLTSALHRRRVNIIRDLSFVDRATS